MAFHAAFRYSHGFKIHNASALKSPMLGVTRYDAAGRSDDERIQVLVTNNLREFERVPGLSVENWIVEEG